MKKFSTLTIATVITDRFLTPDFNDVKDFLSYITGENLYTHQLPRAADKCEKFLNKSFPQIAAIKGWVNDQCEQGKVKLVQEFLIKCFGEELEVKTRQKCKALHNLTNFLTSAPF